MGVSPWIFAEFGERCELSFNIEILDFAMKAPYLAFAKKCAALHENKSYSDVDIKFTIPFK